MAKPTYDELYNMYRDCLLEREELFLENDELKDRIIKAIGFINWFDYYIPEDNKSELLDILKGSGEK